MGPGEVFGLLGPYADTAPTSSFYSNLALYLFDKEQAKKASEDRDVLIKEAVAAGGSYREVGEAGGFDGGWIGFEGDLDVVGHLPVPCRRVDQRGGGGGVLDDPQRQDREHLLLGPAPGDVQEAEGADGVDRALRYCGDWDLWRDSAQVRPAYGDEVPRSSSTCFAASMKACSSSG